MKITCLDCGRVFEHTAKRGRPPVRCPEHRAAPLTRKVAKPRNNHVPVVPNIRPTEIRRATGTGIRVCGACGSAPRDVNRTAAHLRCHHDDCACNLLNHQPDESVRRYQAAHNQLTIEECAERDPGVLVALKN